jgi:hypothetical protein
MRRWKKIGLILLAVIVLSQLPFAYRRYKLRKLATTIQQINSQRQTYQTADGGYAEYKGVIHVHSFLGGHSSGTFQDIIEAAAQRELDFVVMTEHPAKSFDTAAMTLKGVHATVLFVNGNEVVTADQDRLLLMPGDETAARAANTLTRDLLDQGKRNRSLAFVAYPQEFKSWDATGFDGVEVYNVFTNARQINPLITFFDGLWAFRGYPDFLFATFYTRPTDALKKWDDAIAAQDRRLVAIAGNDAHANVGVSLNDSTGKTLLGIKLDPYERSFGLVRMHVLLENGKELNTDSLLSALHDGHCFIGFDLFGNTEGFRFAATNGAERRIQGDEINLGDGVRLQVNVPASSRIVLLKNGSKAQEWNGVSSKEFVITEKGVYRVEVYLPQLPKPAGDQPWIISNPIYVR